MIEKNNIFNLVYDEWIGENPVPNLLSKFPNSQMNDPEHLILHYQDDSSYSHKFEKRKYALNDISKNPNLNFYYIINHGGINLHEFFLDERNIDDVKIVDPIDDRIKNLLRETKNLFLIFLTEHEPDNEKSFRIINEYFKNNNIPLHKIYVVNNNSKLIDYKIKYNSDINVYKLNFIPHSSTKVLIKLGGCQFVENKKGKFFMCFNKSPKRHRYALLCYLKKFNLLDNINWSLVPTWNSEPKDDFYSKIFDKNEMIFFNDEINYFYDTKIKRSDYEKDKGWFNEFEDINRKDFPIWLHNPELMENYESSYVNIITESMFFDSENNIHISEKSFKPFFYYQYPLILSTCGHIKKMKDLYDFDFFDDIINHSYDDETNQKNRLKMFVDEIERLNKMKDEISKHYNSNKKRFEENKNKVIELLKLVDDDYNFFHSLI